MALLDSLNQTNLGLGGNTPTGYTPANLVNSLGSTQLDVNDGATPSPYVPANLVNSLGSTQLDLNDGATPTKYLDNPPQ